MNQDAIQQSLAEHSPTDADFHANLEMYAYGIPLEYILGKLVIKDQAFHIDRRVHIPNSKSSSIIDIIVGLLPENGMAIDVGTGCGWIGILIKKLRPDATVLLTDLDAGALEVAKKNSDFHGVDVKFVKSHLLKKVELDRNPNIIIANLSYRKRQFLSPGEADSSHEHLPLPPIASAHSSLSIYSDLIDNILQLGFRPDFILEVGHVGDAIVQRKLQFPSYKTEIIRHMGFGFAIVTRQ